MSRRDDLATLIDAEILGIRARHAARLSAEHARQAAARQAKLDAATVAEREANVLVRRVTARVQGCEP